MCRLQQIGNVVFGQKRSRKWVKWCGKGQMAGETLTLEPGGRGFGQREK